MLVRSELEHFQGQEAKQTGDGFLATFDGPARAIRCACVIRERLLELGIENRAGLHTGECELVCGDVRGMAVHIAARVMSSAGAGEILVSSTVKDLVIGSGIRFDARGGHILKGAPGEWALFAVQTTHADGPGGLHRACSHSAETQRSRGSNARPARPRDRAHRPARPPTVRPHGAGALCIAIVGPGRRCTATASSRAGTRGRPEEGNTGDFATAGRTAPLAVAELPPGIQGAPAAEQLRQPERRMPFLPL